MGSWAKVAWGPATAGGGVGLEPMAAAKAGRGMGMGTGGGGCTGADGDVGVDASMCTGFVVVGDFPEE